MKQYVYLAKYHVLDAGFGYAEEKEGFVTVLARDANEAKDFAQNELEVEHPKAMVSVQVMQSIGY
ncbi:hypothetical protein [Hyphomicrobium sp. ghe19]|uniref:hypothetical protein n=1 Tax=Hyphomicrobium sp. ghe19 TaxID=2682968 RepID=UPI0013676034|nr:hypothetical protein HYPP_02424 [Hyphomicrobium sp. ghe19]